MKLHANAKLGLAGRRELVLAIEGGMSLRQAAGCFERVAGDSSPLVAPLDWGRPSGCDAARSVISAVSASPLWSRVRSS
jgi:hypothetical protein